MLTELALIIQTFQTPDNTDVGSQISLSVAVCCGRKADMPYLIPGDLEY
jgi:hypothetical protein